MEQNLLIATDEDAERERKYPAPRDTADEELHEEHYQTKKTSRTALRCLTVGFLAMTGVALHEAHKPPREHYARILNGQFTWGHYDDTNYVAQPLDAIHALQDWGGYRYRRYRTAPKGSSPIAEFAKSYLFYAPDVAKAMMEEDTRLGLIANVVKGSAPEQDVVGKPVVILEAFGRQSIGGHLFWAGRAIVNVQIEVATSATAPAHREHLVIPVDFYLNPGQVPLRTAEDASYQDINGAGLVILRKPIENIVNDANFAPPLAPSEKLAGNAKGATK